ncbi:MAG: hypothetical protein Q9221_008744 [Calogaya cf. arnoldii]
MAQNQSKEAGAANTSAYTVYTPVDDQANRSDPVRTFVDNERTNMEAKDHVRHNPTRQALNDNSATHLDKSSTALDKDSDSSLEHLGQGMGSFITLIQVLRDLGVEEFVLPLPKIVVISDRSAGKPSLIERISVIKKRHTYEDTHVPPPFSIRTTARRERMTKDRPFGPWVAQTMPENFLFFKTNTKAEIPEALYLAQMATLNPGSDPARYLPGAKNDSINGLQTQFSPNIIRLDISSPDVPNLSFYDLPEVINQAEFPEEEYLATLVQNLVRNYIEDDACINLLAMPMTDDAANSTASRLVHEAGATERTIGVLTKPDRVLSEGTSQWLAIIEGRKFKIGHGYYVVRNDPDTEISNAVARQKEDRFFNQELWAGTLGAHRERFGTSPKVEEQVRLKTSEIIPWLKELPGSPKGNLSLRLFEKISAFGHDLARHLDGGSEEYPFQKEFHAAALRFSSTIAFSYPRLSLVDYPVAFKSSVQVPYRLSATQTPTPAGNRCLDVISIDSDEEYDATPKSTQTPTLSKRKKHSIESPQSGPPKRSRLDRIPQFVAGQDTGRNNSGSSIDRKAPFAKRFTLADIRTVLLDAQTGLPNQIDPKATKRMIRESRSRWDEPLNELLDYTSQSERRSTKVLENAYRNERVKAFLTKINPEWHTNVEDHAKLDKMMSKVTNAQLGPNPFSKELKAMADVRGYYVCASSRFVDVIYQGIQTELFTACRNEFGEALKQGIGLEEKDAERRCSILLGVDPGKQKIREELLKQQRNPEVASQLLEAQ